MVSDEVQTVVDAEGEEVEVDCPGFDADRRQRRRRVTSRVGRPAAATGRAPTTLDGYRARMSSASTDVLVVGGGPAGCATAIRSPTPATRDGARSRTGPSLVPRGDLARPGRRQRTRALDVDVRTPSATPCSARGCATATGRCRCDGRRHRTIRTRRSSSNATVWTGTARPGRVGRRRDLRMGPRATTPLVDRGFVRGATVHGDGELDDGSTTEISLPFPRRRRRREQPLRRGTSARTAIVGGRTPCHRARPWCAATAATSSWVETHLGPLDANGQPGDRARLGATRAATARSTSASRCCRATATSWASTPQVCSTCSRSSVADRWQFDPTEPLVQPMRWRTPVGGSVVTDDGPDVPRRR